MTYQELMNLQEQGHVKHSQTSLTEANRLISVVRNATPETWRHLFRSYIRHDKDGYEWGWVLK